MGEDGKQSGWKRIFCHSRCLCFGCSKCHVKADDNGENEDADSTDSFVSVEHYFNPEFKFKNTNKLLANFNKFLLQIVHNFSNPLRLEYHLYIICSLYQNLFRMKYSINLDSGVLLTFCSGVHINNFPEISEVQGPRFSALLPPIAVLGCPLRTLLRSGF